MRPLRPRVRIRSAWTTGLILIGLALGTDPAAATRSADPAPVAAVVREADQVVHGTILTAITVRDDYEVRTTYTIQPSTPGTAPLRLTLPGGQLGDVTVQPVGVPVWSPDDEIIVCLDDAEHPLGDGLFTVDGALLVDPWHRPSEAALRVEDLVSAHLP